MSDSDNTKRPFRQVANGDSKRMNSRQALAGIKVVEWCEFVAGPYCCKLLADLGAEVVKIEKPKVGDAARWRGQFQGGEPNPERSGLFSYLNTNKMGITLDVESARGKELFRELIRESDVLVEDKKPQRVQELGLRYDTLKSLNPRLIVTSITPFGQTGPYKDYKAYYLNTYHAGGDGYLLPGRKEASERPPCKGGGYVGETASGLMAAIATLGAVYGRAALGSGQHVDLSKQEALLMLNRGDLSRYPNEGIILNRNTRGYQVGGIMRCKDGYIQIAVHEDQQWQGLMKLMGNPAWSRDEGFKDRKSCMEHSSEVNRYLSEWLMTQTKEDLFQKGQALGCTIAAYYTPEEVKESVQAKVRGFFVDIEHPKAGTSSFPSSAYRFSETPWQVCRAAPLLGQHNTEVYCGRLGHTKQELEMLTQSGIM